MNPWRPYPLLRPGLAFLVGVITVVAGAIQLSLPLWVPALFVLALFLQALLPGILASFHTRWVQGALLNITAFLLGNQLAVQAQQDLQHTMIPVPGQEHLFIGKIREQPAGSSKSVRITLDVWQVEQSSHQAASAGRMVLYLRKEPVTTALSEGHLLLFTAIPERIPGPIEPGGFNACAWYASKGILHRIFVGSGRWRILSLHRTFSLRAEACRIRDRLLEILSNNGMRGQELAVASALLLGYVNDIDRELMQDYSATGAMHVLSVSGMHAGIVFLFLETILCFMNKRRILVFFKAILVVVSIFAYALITGLSPPVLRAALMLSLMVTGKAMKRQPELFNILTASLILLVAWNPLLVTDLGFQFSYLAVAGIVWLYKPVYDRYVTSSWFPDKVWSLVAVSLVAQLATFPLGIYRFHQFPNYFLLTNLLVVPLSSIIIYFGIFTLAAGSVPVLSTLSGQVLSFMITGLNGSIRLIESLPGSVTQGLELTLTEMLTLYVIVGSFCIFILWKKKQFLLIMLGSVIVVAGLSMVGTIQERGQKQISFYGRGDSLLIHAKSGDHEQIYARRSSGGGVLEPVDKVHKNQKKSKKLEITLGRYSSYTMLYNRRIGFLWGKLPYKNGNPVKVDILVIFFNRNYSLTNLLEWYDPKQIIVVSSRYHSFPEEMREYIEKQRVQLHLLDQDGAFTTSF